VALDRARDALAGRGVEVGDVRDRQPASVGGVDDGAAERVLGGASTRRGEPQQLVAVEAGGRDDRGDRRAALGEGAGLVDDEGVDLLHQFERLGVLDQHAEPAPRPTPTMIDIGVARPSAQGQRDDQARDRDDERVGQPRVRPTVAQTRNATTADDDHRRHEPGRDPVGRALDRRAGRCASATICTIRRASCRARPCPRA
jgi:hypothetical protein